MVSKEAFSLFFSLLEFKILYDDFCNLIANECIQMTAKRVHVYYHLT